MDEMTTSTMSLPVTILLLRVITYLWLPPLGRMQLQKRTFTVKLSWMTRGNLLEIIGFALEEHLLSVVDVNWGEHSVSSHYAWLVMALFVLLFVSSGTVMSVRLTTCTLNMLKTPCSLSTSQTSPRTNASPGQSVYLFFCLFISSFLFLFNFNFLLINQVIIPLLCLSHRVRIQTTQATRLRVCSALQSRMARRTKS